VYRAISHEGLLSIHQHPNPLCPIGGNIQGALDPIFEAAQNALEKSLEGFNVADILENTRRQNARE